MKYSANKPNPAQVKNQMYASRDRVANDVTENKRAESVIWMMQHKQYQITNHDNAAKIHAWLTAPPEIKTDKKI